MILAVAPSAASGTGATGSKRPTWAELADLDASNLQVAAAEIELQALSSGALKHRPAYRSSAKILLASVEALTSLARSADPSLGSRDTTAVMGSVPSVISHHLRTRPRHFLRRGTHTLLRFSRPILDGGSSGIGHHRKHDGEWPAPVQRPDGSFVDPSLQAAKPLTIGIVAVRAALGELGQPYVWGGAGAPTFDCSGLVQWAYAHAGLRLAHHAADQWNEGRLIPGRDILPGDLIMFGRPIFHVGMYLGAGWMVNAPYTGQWVDVVPVPSHVAGVVRP